MSQLQNKIILSGQYGPGNSGSLLRFLIALLFFSIQGFIFSGHIELGLNRVSSWMPLAIGVILLLMNLAYRSSKGKFSIYPDQILIGSGGSEMKIETAGIAEVKMDKNHFALLDASGKILARVFNPVPAFAGGMLWMLVHHKEGLGDNITGFIKGGEEIPASSMAIRSFFLEGDFELFSDPGFLISISGKTWFFPIEDAFALPGKKQGFNSVSQALSQAPQPLRFEPSPGLLPLFPVIRAVVDSSLSPEEKINIIGGIADEHGGMELGNPSADGVYSGDFSGFHVEIHRGGN